MIRNHVHSDHRFLTREFHSRTSCCNKTLLFTYSHGLKLNTVVPTRMLRAFNVIDILINITIQIFSWKFSWNLPISTMSMIKLLVSSEESLNESIARYHDRKAVNASRSVSQKPSVRQQSFYTLATQPQDNQLHSLLNAKQRLKTATGQSASHSGYPCAIIPPTPLLWHCTVN